MENKLFEMSYFNAPITNKVPLRSVSLQQVAAAIASDWLKPQTDELRLIADEVLARRYKGWRLPYVTPAGVFSYCSDQSQLSHSGLLCMDIDHYPKVEQLKQQLIDDPLFVTRMAFRSPSGNGLKWLVEIDLGKCGHREWFAAVRQYLMTRYGLSEQQADAHVGNPSRACFLCCDPDVYVNIG